MDRIKKQLSKLNAKEREIFQQLLLNMKAGNLRSLDCKKLKGRSDIYRVRKGRMRVIFRIDTAREYHILAVERRSEKTYRAY